MTAPRARRADLEWVVVDDELGVFDPCDSSLHRANATAAAIWAACGPGDADHDRDDAAIVRAVAAATGTAPAAIERDVVATLEMFAAAGLLRGPAPAPCDPFARTTQRLRFVDHLPVRAGAFRVEVRTADVDLAHALRRSLAALIDPGPPDVELALLTPRPGAPRRSLSVVFVDGVPRLRTADPRRATRAALAELARRADPAAPGEVDIAAIGAVRAGVAAVATVDWRGAQVLDRHLDDRGIGVVDRVHLRIRVADQAIVAPAPLPIDRRGLRRFVGLRPDPGAGDLPIVAWLTTTGAPPVVDTPRLVAIGPAATASECARRLDEYLPR